MVRKNKIFKISFLVIAIFLVTLIPFGETGVSKESKSAKIKGWYLIWRDEFEGDSIDKSKWVVEDAALVKNNELQYYTPEDVYIHDGVLTLRSQKRSMVGRKYTSGLVETKGKFSQRYGRFEIRAKLPKGKGMWPAHWLLPEGGGWPPEIDIMEMVGHNTHAVSGAIHWGVWPQNKFYSRVFRGPDFSEDFHTFAIEWEPDEVRWYVDNEKYFSVYTNIPQEPFYLILNTAVGGNMPGSPDETTIFPQYHDIDYVRVYAKEIKGTYFLTTSAENGYIKVKPKKDRYKSNLKVKLGAYPYLGYKFSHWSGNLESTHNPIKITMSRHAKIKAHFIEDPNAPKLLSRGMPVKASSIESAELTPSKAVDGSIHTRWSSEFSDPQWIYIDLGKIYPIEAIRLRWENAYARAYKIQVSDDATRWRTVYSTKKGKGKIEEITGLDTNARYVRMYGVARNREWGYSLWEFEVFGREEKFKKGGANER